MLNRERATLSAFEICFPQVKPHWIRNRRCQEKIKSYIIENLFARSYRERGKTSCFTAWPWGIEKSEKIARMFVCRYCPYRSIYNMYEAVTRCAARFINLEPTLLLEYLRWPIYVRSFFSPHSRLSCRPQQVCVHTRAPCIFAKVCWKI